MSQAIFMALDELIDNTPNPKLILLGTKTFQRLDDALGRLGLGVRFQVEQKHQYSGIDVVVVEGRSELMQCIPGDEQCTVRANSADFRDLLQTFTITKELRAAINDALSTF